MFALTRASFSVIVGRRVAAGGPLSVIDVGEPYVESASRRLRRGVHRIIPNAFTEAVFSFFCMLPTMRAGPQQCSRVHQGALLRRGHVSGVRSQRQRVYAELRRVFLLL